MSRPVDATDGIPLGGPYRPELADRPALARQAAPFIGAAVLGFALVFLPPRFDVLELSLAAALLAVCLALLFVFPWTRPGYPGGIVPPLLYLVVVGLMRNGQGGASSGYAPLAMLPVFWLALYGTRRQLAVCVCGVGVLYASPLVPVLGGRYQESELRRAILWTAISVLIGFTTYALVRRREHEARERARERDFMTAVLGNTGALVLAFDAQERIVSFNRAAEQASGVEAADVLGRTLWDLDVVPPEDVEQLRGAFARTLADAEPVENENWWVARDGTRRLHRWTNAVLQDATGAVTHVIAMGIDVTAERVAEDALRAQAELFGSVLSAATEYSIIGTTLDGTITVFNEGAERMLGYTAAEVIGQITPEAIHDATEVVARAAELGIEPGFEVFVLAALELKSETREWTYIRKDGGRIPVSLTVTAIRGADGEPVGFIGVGRDITAQRQAERALRESEARYRLLMQNLPDTRVSLFDTELRRVSIDDTVVEGGETADGRRVGADLAESVSVPAFAMLKPRFEAALAGEGSAIEFESESDGVIYDLQIAPYRDDTGAIVGALSVGRDVTRRRAAERQLAAQYAVSRILAENPPTTEALPRVLAAVSRPLGVKVGLAWAPGEEPNELSCLATFAAPGFEDAADALAADPIGFGAGPVGEAWSRLQAVSTGGADTRAPRLGAPMPPVLHHALALPIVGMTHDAIGVVELVGFERPVTSDVVDAVESIASQFAQFVERRRAELASAQAQEEFVANVSHELRTPLTSITGWVEVLLSGAAGPLTEEQSRFLTTVQRNGERLLHLVSDLLLAGQVDAGRLTLELETIDAAAIAQETVELLATLATAKQIEVVVEADGPALLVGDRARLSQLLNNLLSNAIKFTPAGGAVGIKVATHDGRCTVEVNDSGIGIPPDERERLFSRFYRASTATAQGIGGTGLGLAISKEIAEAHGGTIGVGDSPTGGTSFTVELPLAGPAAAVADEVSAGS